MTIVSEAKSSGIEPLRKTESIRILAFIEASSITGPAKNLIEFAAYTNGKGSGSKPIQLSIATYQRVHRTPVNEFVAAARDAGIGIDLIQEHHAFDLRVIPQIRGILASVRPQAIQTHNVKSHLLIWLMRLHRQYPWLAFHHGYTSMDWRDRIYRHFNRISLPNAHRVVTVCHAFATDLENIGVLPERITVRHNMVRSFVPSGDDEIRKIRSNLGLTSGELVLLSAGRLSREKGHADLLDAVAQLRTCKHVPPFRVLVAGDGPERKNLLLRLHQLGIDDLVVLVGHQSDLRPYYTLADIVVLPSHSEGSPNVLLEAMAAQIAVVATSVGGVPEIVENEQSALLVPKHEPRALSTAMQRLLVDSALRKRLAQNAQLRSESYSGEAYSESLLNTWRELLRQSAPGIDRCGFPS